MPVLQKPGSQWSIPKFLRNRRGTSSFRGNAAAIILIEDEALKYLVTKCPLWQLSREELPGRPLAGTLMAKKKQQAVVQQNQDDVAGLGA